VELTFGEFKFRTADKSIWSSGWNEKVVLQLPEIMDESQKLVFVVFEASGLLRYFLPIESFVAI
jgi:hypothetical protein